MPDVSRIRGSLLISFAQKYSELSITFVSTVILSRLLTPEEVGIFSVVATILVVAHMFRDFGVSQYLIQESNLTDEKIISAFLVTLLCSYSIAAILYFSAGRIAQFFGRQEIEHVVDLILINFLLIPFGSVSLSLLRKAMNFAALYKINVLSTLFGAFVSIILAYQGFSYMSLVWGSVCGTLVTVILATFFRAEVLPCRPRFQDFKTVFSFGSKVSYITILLNSIHHLPEILIGKLFGMASVGVYSRAAGLVRIFQIGFMQGVLPVLLPHLVSVVDASKDIRKDYLKIVETICILAWPFFIFISILADPIVLTLYGEAWKQAAQLIVWLSLASALNTICAINSDVFIAIKKVDTSVKVQTIAQLSAVIIMLFSSIFGLKSLLLGIVISKFITVLVSGYYISRVSSISVLEIMEALRKPLILAVSCAVMLVSVANIYYIFFSSRLYLLALSAVCFLIVFLSISVLLKTELYVYFISIFRSK